MSLKQKLNKMYFVYRASTDFMLTMEPSAELSTHLTTQLVDKAVSTEDLRYATRDVNLDVVRLEAVLNTLVENKVEAMKNEKSKSSSSHSTPMAWDKRMQRITSSSTASDSHKDVNHGHEYPQSFRHYHKKRVRAHEYDQMRKTREGHRSNGESKPYLIID